MKKILLASTAFAVLLSSPVFAQAEKIPGAQEVIDMLNVPAEQGMNLQSILKAAYQQNPTIMAARANLKAVEANKGLSQSGFLPKLNANGAITYSDVKNEGGGASTSGFSRDGDNTAKSAGVDLEQPIFRGGTTVADIRRANELINAAKAELLTAERQVLYATAQAYMDVLREEALVKLNENNRKLLARQLKATRDRFEVGDLTRTDVSQAEFRLARAEADLTAARGNLRVASAVFEQYVGFSPKGLSFPKISLDLPETVEEAAQMAEKNNPDVHGAMFMHNAAVDQISSVRGELLPQVKLQADITKTYDSPSGYDETREDTIGVVASMPLYEGGAIRARVRQAREIANQRRIEITQTERSAHQEATSAFENLTAAIAEIESREAQLDAAEIARKGVREEADVGDRTVLDTLDADQEVLDAQTSLINAKRNEVVARFALASAVGVLNGVNMPFLVGDTPQNGDKVP